MVGHQEDVLDDNQEDILDGRQEDTLDGLDYCGWSSGRCFGR